MNSEEKTELVASLEVELEMTETLLSLLKKDFIEPVINEEEGFIEGWIITEKGLKEAPELVDELFSINEQDDINDISGLVH